MENNGLTLDVPVKFKQVGIGENTARIGFSVQREVLDIDRADEVFCDRRLNGAVRISP